MTKLVTPAVKGQITKALKADGLATASTPQRFPAQRYVITRDVLARYMPWEQAKHAAEQLTKAVR